jgi:hypothetical protein
MSTNETCRRAVVSAAEDEMKKLISLRAAVAAIEMEMKRLTSLLLIVPTVSSPGQETRDTSVMFRKELRDRKAAREVCDP